MTPIDPTPRVRLRSSVSTVPSAMGSSPSWKGYIELLDGSLHLDFTQDITDIHNQLQNHQLRFQNPQPRLRNTVSFQTQLPPSTRPLDSQTMSRINTMKQRTNQPAMMRIAIAGAGGFAQILAQQISQTAHALLVLSRRPHPELEEYCPGCQVAIVDYDDVENLRYTLQGVDLVISTIAGNEQLNLIDAARRARVRVFVPSEFEGDLSHRPANDPLDRGSHSALELLEGWSQSKSHRLRYTVFSCGVFMERFGPGGLQTYGIGAGCGIQGPDDYLVNIQEARSEIIPTNSAGRPVRVSMTSVYDVAQFITAAIELGLDTWPKEFRMRGDSITVQELVETCSNTLGVPISLVTRHYQEVEAQAEACQQRGDWTQWYYFQRLLQTANGRYHVRQANLNDTTQVQPLTFRRWLENVWVPII